MLTSFVTLQIGFVALVRHCQMTPLWSYRRCCPGFCGMVSSTKVSDAKGFPRMLKSHRMQLQRFFILILRGILGFPQPPISWHAWLDLLEASCIAQGWLELWKCRGLGEGERCADIRLLQGHDKGNSHEGFGLSDIWWLGGGVSGSMGTVWPWDVGRAWLCLRWLLTPTHRSSVGLWSFEQIMTIQGHSRGLTLLRSHCCLRLSTDPGLCVHSSIQHFGEEGADNAIRLNMKSLFSVCMCHGENLDFIPGMVTNPLIGIYVSIARIPNTGRDGWPYIIHTHTMFLTMAPMSYIDLYNVIIWYCKWWALWTE